jgi:hypothetical protein
MLFSFAVVVDALLILNLTVDWLLDAEMVSKPIGKRAAVLDSSY